MRLYLINILEKKCKITSMARAYMCLCWEFYVIFFALLQMSTQNDLPANIVAGNVFLFVKFHVHGPKRSGARGPASFKPTFEAIVF